jgi:mannose-1-phosphate guanylyltransferase
MDAPKHNSAHVWSIVLAHGRGQRLAALVKRWLSNRGTKSCQTVAGNQSSSESLVDHDPISPHYRITVTDQEAVTAGGAAPRGQVSGKLLIQPRNCGTAPAVFLGLTHVMSEDPEAMVVVYPSDHFIYPGARFAQILNDATKIARELKQWTVLVGVRSERFETEHGWIRPGVTLGWTDGSHLRRIEALQDRSNVKSRRTALASGCVCNTSILAASATSLWEAARDNFPTMLRLFQDYQSSIRSDDQQATLRAAYETMPVLDLSTDILQSILNQVMVMELSHVVWSDWRKPEGIVDRLRVIGKSPAFAAKHMLTL